MKLADKPKGGGDLKDAVYRSSGSSTRVGAGRKEVIKKFPVSANLTDYECAYSSFSWDQAKADINWFAEGKLNAGYNAVDRHMHDGRRNKVALYSVDAQNRLETFTFQDMHYLSNRLGNALKGLGVVKGDRVFVFMPRIAELYISTVAIAKIGAVIGPLFSAFGPDALKIDFRTAAQK